MAKNFKNIDGDDFDAVCAGIDKLSASGQSILDKDNCETLDLTKDADKARFVDIVKGKVRGYTFDRDFKANQGRNAVITINEIKINKALKDSLSGKSKYAEFGMWVEHPELAVPGYCWLRNMQKDGKFQFTAEDGNTLKGKFAILKAGQKLVSLSKDKKTSKIVCYTDDVVISCCNGMEVFNATIEDRKVQSVSFYEAGEVAFAEAVTFEFNV